MPTLTTTIEDTSPVIVYSGSAGGDWVAGTSANDSATDQYSQSSFMVTQAPGASVSFSFYGTGVQIYGAKRANHGLFQIQIDSTVYPQVSGKASNPEVFQTALFSTVALNNGFHNVTMTNVGSGTTALDIDFLSWQTPIGLTNEPLLSLTAQDSELSFKYTPESEWNASPSNLGMFSGGSGHVTTTAGAFVEYTFSGSAVALFGPVGPNCAPYSVRLDQGPSTNYSSYKKFYRSQTMLFQASNLPSGEHTIRIVSEAWNNSGLSLGIDYAEVFTTPSLQKSSTGLSAGAIAGISIGSIASFLLLLFLGFLVVIRRRGLPLSNLKPSFLRLKGRSRRKTSELETQGFDYQPIITPPGVVDGGYVQLDLQTPSHTPLNVITPHSSGMRTLSDGTYGADRETTTPDPSTTSQVITIPYTADGKYRPDLSSAAMPQLMPPPQRQSQVQRNITPSVPPSGLPPGAMLPDSRGLQNRAVLTPVRRPGQSGYVESRRQNMMLFDTTAMGRDTSGTNNVTVDAMSQQPPQYRRSPL